MAKAPPDTGKRANGAQRPSVLSTDAIEPPEKPPRKRGRPKGQAKSRGRQKGTKNWTHPEIRNALLGRSDAIEVLADIVAGRPLLVGTHTGASGVGKPAWRYPTMAERLTGLGLVLKKILPDLSATELSGKDGEPLLPLLQQEPRQLARAVISVLSGAVPGGSITIEKPGTFTAKFQDAALGERVLGNGETEAEIEARLAGYTHPAPLAEENEGMRHDIAVSEKN